MNRIYVNVCRYLVRVLVGSLVIIAVGRRVANRGNRVYVERGEYAVGLKILNYEK